ncbi:LCP family protein [Alloscardovia venturai]|uniref:LCP family protein n=1 Tax=Alloscardovia venturai TaxID=1769421 RepID=A0ABW2Y3M4_9BIFI
MGHRPSKHSNTSVQRVSVSHAPAHSHGYKAPIAMRTVAIALTAIIVFIAAAAGAIAVQLNSIIDDSSVSVIAQKNVKKEIIDPNAGKALDILVLGTDSRDGNENSAIGGASEVGNHQADTTMVVHISANRKFINIVSIPRDSMVSVPSCETSKGTIPAQSHVMFNSIFANAYNVGGDLASASTCTMSAVNALTGLSISQFITVDFAGLKNMIDALSGVDVCIAEDFHDDNTNLTLTAGLNHLNGTDATQYARVRHGLGDGSDVMRTVRQQYLVKMLMREALNKSIFTQPQDLYRLATTALQSLNISEGMAKSGTLVGLASSLKNFKTSNIYSQTVPIKTDPTNPNRVVWASSASDVWKRMTSDKPLTDEATDTDDNLNDSSTADSGNSSNSTSDNSTGSASSNSDNSSSTSSSSNNSSSSSSTQSNNSASSSNGTNTASGTVDPHTGLIVQADGTLIDPQTGGYVTKDDAIIHDQQTGWYVGLAQRYLNYTFCKIES